MTENSREELLSELSINACPPIEGAIPPWPSKSRQKSVWFGLHKDGFVYTHHASHGHGLDKTTTIGNQDAENLQANNLFCIPEYESLRLESTIRNSRGGSILVTGYRGTGKSSLVNYTINRIMTDDENNKTENRRKKVPIRINLSTSRNAKALVNMIIKEIYLYSQEGAFGDVHQQAVSDVYSRAIASIAMQYSDLKQHGATIGAEVGTGSWMNYFFSGKTKAESTRKNENSIATTMDYEPYSLHEAQLDLHRLLRLLRGSGYDIIFIFDELDKLTPKSEDIDIKPYTQKLIDLQNIVSDLKFLLTESNAYHIFIAGKDVDDSWQEDQNKGEGLFESVYVQNIYLPSTLTIKLQASLGPHNWVLNCWKSKKENHYSYDQLRMNHQNEINKLFEGLLNELGISTRNWTYNTGLLVLPHFSEQEIKKILLRLKVRLKKQYEKKDGDNISDDKLIEMIKNNHNKYEWFIPLIKVIEKDNDTNLHPMTERRCRKIRYLLQYLTYKGRGIPRKVLRELYGFIQHWNVLGIIDSQYKKGKGDSEYIIYIPTQVRQKMKFFSSIVSIIESNIELFRSLDDKGCVATFHILDYILKFYRTGFTWKDIENASFMTERQELFPSRELVSSILEILEDFIIERLDRRNRTYRLLPRVQHDLVGLYTAFGPEQIELRFTKAEYSAEITRLESILQNLNMTNPDQRLESFRAQLRLGEIYEDMGNHFEARLAYKKAMRWIRMDIERMGSYSDKITVGNIAQLSIITYSSSAIDALQRLGYLYELDREFPQAMLCYQEAIRLYEFSLSFSCQPGEQPAANNSSILDNPIRLSTCESNIYEHKMEPGNKEDNIIIYDEDMCTSVSNKIDSDMKNYQLDDFLDFKLIVDTMVPSKHRKTIKCFLNRFGEATLFAVNSEMRTQPNCTAIVPNGYWHTINMIAINMEKMWHRITCNIYLLSCLDYLIKIGDDYGKVDQMIFIGELLIRRRDIRTAALWYLLALNELEAFQWQDDKWSKSAKKPELQSSIRAKLYEYMGDVFSATSGTALIKHEQLKHVTSDNADNNGLFTQSLKKGLHVFMNHLRERLPMKILDERDDEYFYSQASIHYMINKQQMRSCDVYFKKLEVRRNRLVESLRNTPVDWKNNYNDNVGEVIRSWCSFWNGAEKILNLLIDTGSMVRNKNTLEYGRIVDRRRFGVLYTRIGNILFYASNNNNLPKLYWNAEGESISYKEIVEKYIFNRLHSTQTESIEDKDSKCIINNALITNTNIFESAKTIDRLLGVLIDNDELIAGLSENERLNTNLCEKNAIGSRSALWNLSSTKWRRNKIPYNKIFADTDENSKHNMFLFGNIYYLFKSYKGEDNHSDMECQIRMLYRAELCLLGAHINLDDNIRDLDAAEASKSLGLLYLQGLKMLLDIRDEMTKDNNINEYDDYLALICQLLHTSSKRFLTNAINIFHNERTHERCVRQSYGATQRALGELCLIWEEVLVCRMNEKENHDALSGLKKPWKEINDYIDKQIEIKEDNIVYDIRMQANDAFKEACKQFLSEIEEYTKRYRFPHQAYYRHQNIMDRQMHYDICKNIMNRHYDVLKLEQPTGGIEAIKKLNNITWELSLILGERLPRTAKRDEWLEDMSKIINIIAKICPTPPYIKIEENKMKWINEKERKKIYDENYITTHFFRSYNDQIITWYPNKGQLNFQFEQPATPGSKSI